MFCENQYFSFIHLIDLLSTYYIPTGVQGADTCISEKWGGQQRARALAALKRRVLEGVDV